MTFPLTFLIVESKKCHKTTANTPNLHINDLQKTKESVKHKLFMFGAFFDGYIT